MKTTVDIPEQGLREVIRHARARTKRAAILAAVRAFNKRKRLEALNRRVRGAFRDFMTQEELQGMRKDGRWEAMP